MIYVFGGFAALKTVLIAIQFTVCWDYMERT